MLRFIFPILFGCLLLSGCTAEEDNERAVSAAFDLYIQAALSGDGEKALEVTDSRTVSYYDEIATKVREFDSAAVAAEPKLIDKVNILTIRHFASKEEIDGFDGKKLIVFSIQNGLVGKEELEKHGLGKITVNGDEAKAQFLLDGKRTPFNYKFFREAGRWKVSIIHNMNTVESAFETIVQEQGWSLEELIKTVLMDENGMPPATVYWNPKGADSTQTE